jgi:hypothetical protein
MRKSFFFIFFTLAVVKAYAQIPSASKNPDTSKRFCGIIQNARIVKIDEKVILKNENLQPFINDLRSQPLVLSNKIDDIPGFVKSFLKRLCGGRFTITNPGADWNCCCARDKNKPDRRLICVGRNSNIFVMSYETGGISKTNHLILLRYDGNKITDFWTGFVSEYFKSKDDIVQYLTVNKDKHWGLNTNMLTI